MSKNKKFSIWEGAFLKIEDITTGGNVTISALDNYDSQQWLEKEKNSILSYRKKYSGQIGKNYPPKNSNLPLLFSIINPKRILDYGGSNGWVFEFLKTSVIGKPNNAISEYFIYELEKSCHFFSKFHSYPVKYVSSSKHLEKVDLLYSNSTLQYILEDDEWIDVVKASDPEWILLDDFICHPNEDDYFTMQIYKGKKIVVKFRSIDKFKDSLSKIGYEIISIFPFISGYKTRSENNFLDMEGVPKKFRIEYPHSILIRKIQN